MINFQYVWQDANGNDNRVDNGGNHFINNVCQNNDKKSLILNDVTIPNDAVEMDMVEVIGHVELDIYEDERGITQYVPKV